MIETKTPKGQVLFLSHNLKSRSAKLLQKHFKKTLLSAMPLLDVIQRSPGTHVVINWGLAKSLPALSSAKRVYNKPENVAIVRNKLKFFQTAANSENGPRVPKYWTDVAEALKYLSDNPGKIILGRKYTGSCGEDICFYDDNPDGWNKSDFWVAYKPKKEEYRIHLFKIGDSIRVVLKQRKALRKLDPVTNEPIEKKDADFQIRNHKNGFIFQRNDITVPDDVIQQAIKGLIVSGLDFGAVDVIWNEREQKAYVLEINSAPGLEGTSISDYAIAIKDMIVEKTP